MQANTKAFIAEIKKGIAVLSDLVTKEIYWAVSTRLPSGNRFIVWFAPSQKDSKTHHSTSDCPGSGYWFWMSALLSDTGNSGPI